MSGRSLTVLRTCLPAAAAAGLAGLLVWQGREAMRSHQLKPALEHHVTHHSLGEYRWFTGEPERAVAHFQRALHNHPESVAAHFGLGQVCNQLGRHEEAAASYLRVLQIDPDHADSHVQLANMRLQQGGLADAIRHYEEALRLQPLNATALNNLAWVLATTREDSLRNAPRALELADRASRAQDHVQPHLLVTLAAAQAAAGQFENALTTLENAAQLSGNPDAFKSNLAAHFQAYRGRQPLRLASY